MHQHHAVGPEFVFEAIEPQHGAALPFGDRLAGPPALDTFAGWTDRAWPALGLFPIVLKRPPAPILRLVDLTVAVQPAHRIVSDRAQRNDLLAGLKRHGVVDLHGRDFGIQRQVLRAAVVSLACFANFMASGTGHGRELLPANIGGRETWRE